MKITTALQRRLKGALFEDVGRGDITSALLIPERAHGTAFIVAKQPGIFCGQSVLEEVFKAADSKIKLQFFIKDGSAFRKKNITVKITGPSRSILKAERTALNFLGHLCGIATQAFEFVREVRQTGVKILDTRKTTPLWRELEKYAVRTGGGENHRNGLFDEIFVKENHRIHGDLNRLRAVGGRFEIEVRNMRELSQALALHPRVILFDNFSASDLKELVRRVKKNHPNIILEASGGINLKNVKSYAQTGVDQISIGSLTHSVRAVDFSLLVEK